MWLDEDKLLGLNSYLLLLCLIKFPSLLKTGGEDYVHISSASRTRFQEMLMGVSWRREKHGGQGSWKNIVQLSTFFSGKNPRALHAWRHELSRNPKCIWLWSFSLIASRMKSSETPLWRQQTLGCACCLRCRVWGGGGWEPLLRLAGDHEYRAAIGCSLLLQRAQFKKIGTKENLLRERSKCLKRL